MARYPGMEIALDSAPKQGGKTRLIDRSALDGRTSAAKKFDLVVRGAQADLGGRDQLTTIELALIHAFAGAAVHLESLNARLLLGGPIDLTEHAQAISSLVRIAARLGTRRRAKDVTPSLHEYLQSLEAEPAE